MKTSFYDITATSLQGKEISMSSYKGHVVVVVNTASKCGFTPQYKGLEELYKKYKDKGLVILGFPCNQFGHQEPGSSKEISEGCLINYGVSFPMFQKIEVNGKNAHPLYQFLKNEICNLWGKAIKWNFTKFVIDKNGTVVKRYAPFSTPKAMETFIVKTLEA